MKTEKPTPELIKYFHVHSASLLLMLLLFTDLCFFALHTIEFFREQNPLLSLTQDNGYPELFQYIKWLWIIFLLVYISIRQRMWTFTSWVIFFIYLLFDDALKIHEKVGGFLADNINIIHRFGLRLQDVGELTVSGAAGIILFLLVLVAYKYGTKTFKKISLDLLLLIFLLAFCGIFVDMVHSVLNFGWKINAIATMIEDGGEMIVASIICWYVFLLAVRDENINIYLIDFLRFLPKRKST